MSVRKDARGRWHAEAWVGNRRLHRRLPEGASARQAKELEAELRQALKAATPDRAPVVPGNPLLTELLSDYTERHAKTLRSPDTAKHHARRLFDYVQGKRASETRTVVTAIRTGMLTDYAKATVNRSLGVLKKALRDGWDQGRTNADYSGLVRRMPENNQRAVYLSIEEVKRIADEASAQVRTAIWVSLLTGCRRGEVCKIAAEDISHDVIRIQAGNTKTLRYREVPIAPALRPWLAGLPLSIGFEGVKSGFRRAREASDMSHVTFHDLRRSCGTIMLQAGVDILTVSKILGHSSVKVTEQRYAFLDDGAMLAAMTRAFG